MVDIPRGRILVYSATGSYRDSLMRPGLGRLEFGRPMFLARTRDGYVLNDGMTHLVKLNLEKKPVDSIHLSDQRAAPKALNIMESTWQQGRIFGHSDFQTEAGRGVFGFVWFQVDPLAVAELAEEMELEDKGRGLYGLVGPYLAVIGESPYYLRYGDPSYIGSGAPPYDRLKAFPEEFRQIPQLPPSRGRSTAGIRYRALEQSSSPIALYAEGEFLYLLSRQPEPNGDTLWNLAKIDPQRDAIVGTCFLPTSASYLSIAPGSRLWAVVEQGPVSASGDRREINTLLLIPSEWFGSQESPLAAANAGRLDLCKDPS